MKKFFAAALASAMVVSMAATSFATTQVVEDAFYLEKDGIVNSGVHTSNVDYGKTIYYVFKDGTAVVSDYEAVKGTSIKQKWDMNGTAVEKIEIVKKKNADGVYAYYLAVKSKANNSTSTTDVSGKITLTKNSPTDKKYNQDVDVKFTLGYATAGTKAITSDTQIFNFGANAPGLGSDEEDTITFAGGYMTVNTVGQSKMLISLSTKYNADIANKYNANLDFLTFNGASFNKTGELTIEADPNTFLYQVNADGNLVAVKASYDEYEEAFKFKTRTLGTYVIADSELKLTATTPVDPAKPNPGTGANA